MRAGVRRLLLLATPSPVSYVRDHLSGAEKLALAASPYPSTEALFADCLTAVVDAVVDAAAQTGAVWTRAEFERVRAAPNVDHTRSAIVFSRLVHREYP